MIPYPEPGTYELGKIQEVPFSVVIDGSGYPKLLSSYTTGKITLMTFFYALCTDPTGCPLLWNAFFEVRDKIAEDPELRDEVQLVFYSFDPKHDVPQTLQLFEDLENKGNAPVPWYFVTSWTDYFLKSTLEDFGQPIYADKDSRGRIIINHSLKVFLIDPDGWVREIYASNFLDPGVILNDIKTLVMEERGQSIGQ
ncbi:SCO family protein [Methyloceanibacter sp. wino2]|uniref:SCO family protein n=1 Tax=Methyloceanibacter sp. wino2 TaxID=2170729 RepID=UPI00131F31BC|nr:SCO family protein [Methyloceanibacter sp. wino2]